MKKLNFVFLIFLCVTLSGLTACVSGAKRLAQLELAATHPPELEKLCREGISGACAFQGKPVVLGSPLSIMQGVTSLKQSRFVAMVPKKEGRTYYVRGPRGIFKLESRRTDWRSSPMAADHVEAFDLDPKETYELIIIDADGMAIDRRNFRSLDTTKRNPKLAVISCMDDSLKTEQASMWKLLLEDKPEVILMIGDNVYADRIPGGYQAATPEQLWDRYVDSRNTLDIFKAKDLVPVFATWDDHDYGRNDSDRTYAFKEDSAKVFHAFFAQAQATGEYTRGPGVSSMWSAFGLRFLFLDNRTFRSPNKLDLPDQTHFGVEQEDWIEAQLKSAKEPVLLISGDQFFGGYQMFESYEGSHPKSFTTQLARWKKSKVPIVFVSGDRHLSEVIQVPVKSLGYPTFELTSSPLHAKVFPDAFQKSPNPNQKMGIAGKYNYMLVNIEKSGSKSLQLNVRSKGLDKVTLFEANLAVKK